MGTMECASPRPVIQEVTGANAMKDGQVRIANMRNHPSLAGIEPSTCTLTKDSSLNWVYQTGRKTYILVNRKQPNPAVHQHMGSISTSYQWWHRSPTVGHNQCKS